MSGIAGMYYPDGRPAERAALRRMVDSLAHRGPDGAALWCAGPAGFGHRMLHTTPESLYETLPLTSPDEDLVLTADARIDNRDELIGLLKLPDAPHRPVTDSALILAAYQKWGEACAEKLVGAFAFALWDHRNRKLFCARDHLGVRPFYYAHLPNRLFAFGSEIKALLQLGEVPCVVNKVRLGDYLSLMMADRVITSYEHIYRLPAAHVLTVDAHGLRTRPYWSLDPDREIRYDSAEAYAEAFRAVFQEAVRCRLRSAFPLGTHLSGGLDSSAVSCMARDLLAREGRLPLPTFSSIFEELAPCDEQPFIRAVLEQGGFEPHYLQADRYGPLTDWDAASAHEDEAYLGPNHYLVWHLAQTVRRSGVRVVLDGFDGDTTVSHGTHYFGELAAAGNWKAFAEEAHAYAGRQEGGSPLVILKQFGLPHLVALGRAGRWLRLARSLDRISAHFGRPRRVLFKEVARPLMPDAARRWGRRLRGRPAAPGEALPVAQKGHDSVLLIVNDAFARRMGIEERHQTLETPVPPHALSVRAHQCERLSSGGLAYTLELYDRAAAALSLDVRHPFLDKRLVEFCVALPPELKLHQGWTRWIMRHALAHTLPEKVRWRPGKASMELNFLRGLRLLNREAFDEILHSDLSDVEEFIDTDLVRAAYDRLTSRPRFHPRDTNAVWRAVAVTLWLRRVRAQRPGASPPLPAGEDWKIAAPCGEQQGSVPCAVSPQPTYEGCYEKAV